MNDIAMQAKDALEALADAYAKLRGKPAWQIREIEDARYAVGELIKEIEVEQTSLIKDALKSIQGDIDSAQSDLRSAERDIDELLKDKKKRRP